MASFFSSVVVGWATRLAVVIGGMLFAVANSDPNAIQSALRTIAALLTGQWEDVSLGAVVGLLTFIGGLIWSGRATFRNQVTIDGKQVPLKELDPSPQKTAVEEIARTAISRRRTLVDLLSEKLGRRWP